MVPGELFWKRDWRTSGREMDWGVGGWVRREGAIQENSRAGRTNTNPN